MSRRRARLAILEANNFHEETLFAFASAVKLLRSATEVTVFAPEHWRSREFVRDELGLGCNWHPFADFAAASHEAPFELLLANTFPSPAGQPAMDRALAGGAAVLGLVHDIDYFAEGDARTALERHERLWLAYAGPLPPAGVDELSSPLRKRVMRFFPVLCAGPSCDDDGLRRRVGVAMPGSLEYSRRDFSSALRLTAESGIPISIFGRSRDHGDGPKYSRDLDKERERLLAEVEARGVSDSVAISTDVSCRDFYRTVERARFVAVMTVNVEYLMGKLTGAVTAGLSCGVPMIALPDVQAHYARADSDVFSGCMLPFDPDAPVGRGDDWATIVRGTPDDVYSVLCSNALKARKALLTENVAGIERVLVATAPA